MNHNTKRIEIQLRHNTHDHKLFLLTLFPDQTPIGDKWFMDVQKAIQNRKLLEKEMSFFGWIDSPFNLKRLCDLINTHIDIINEASFRLDWDRKPFIEDKLSPDTLSQETLNKAHHHFELLIGQFWENAKYYKGADSQLRYSIQRLNSLIHEIESYLDTVRYAEAEPNCSIASIRLTYNNVDRELLDPEDYKHFVTDLCFGDINLGYCQSGKTHIEAWLDNDDFIEDNNVNGLRYHSADTIINFTSNRTIDLVKQSQFFDWLKLKGVNNLEKTFFIDKNGQHQGLGWLKVGRFDTKPFEGMTFPEIQKMMGEYQDIYQVSCFDGVAGVTQCFPDRRGSEELRKKITAQL